MDEQKPQCTRGHEVQCQRAKCEQCHCACGGENHGKDRVNGIGKPDAVAHDEASERIPVSPLSKGMIHGFYPSRRVEINGRELSPVPSQKLYNHSPDGFNWGYGGSGVAQLALAILLDLVGEERAMRAYQEFKWKKLATLEQGKGFSMPVSEIINWLNQYEQTN